MWVRTVCPEMNRCSAISRVDIAPTRHSENLTLPAASAVVGQGALLGTGVLLEGRPCTTPSSGRPHSGRRDRRRPP